MPGPSGTLNHKLTSQPLTPTTSLPKMSQLSTMTSPLNRFSSNHLRSKKVNNQLLLLKEIPFHGLHFLKRVKQRGFRKCSNKRTRLLTCGRVNYFSLQALNSIELSKSQLSSSCPPTKLKSVKITQPMK